MGAAASRYLAEPYSILPSTPLTRHRTPRLSTAVGIWAPDPGALQFRVVKNLTARALLRLNFIQHHPSKWAY